MLTDLLVGMQLMDELMMERVMEEFERRCYDNMIHAMETEEGLGIEYDEDVVCDVCQSPDGEDNNEMVFCDKCNICVHQVCVCVCECLNACVSVYELYNSVPPHRRVTVY